MSRQQQPPPHHHPVRIDQGVLADPSLLHPPTFPTAATTTPTLQCILDRMSNHLCIHSCTVTTPTTTPTLSCIFDACKSTPALLRGGLPLQYWVTPKNHREHCVLEEHQGRAEPPGCPDHQVTKNHHCGGWAEPCQDLHHDTNTLMRFSLHAYPPLHCLEAYYHCNTGELSKNHCDNCVLEEHQGCAEPGGCPAH